MYFTPEHVRAACAQHGTIFFTHDLQPVAPKEGQWFCEFHIIETFEGEEVRDEAIVEYLGPDEKFVNYGDGFKPIPVHRVASEYDECDREPRGDVLILQH
jgi:hypothetical protein